MMNVQDFFSPKMNIVIPNATGPKNLGDQIILRGLLQVLKEAFPNARITVHTTDPELLELSEEVRIRQTLGSWAVFENRTFAGRVRRLFKLALAYGFVRLGIPMPFNNRDVLRNIIEDYEEAHLIVFVGGGYLHAQSGFTQFLNLLIQSMPFLFASVFRKPQIIGPISFGPFAHRFEENLVSRLLRRADVVMVREDESYALLAKHKLSNLVRSADLAFLVDVPAMIGHEAAEPVLGFTVRKWFTNAKQKKLEDAFVEALTGASQTLGFAVQPIVHVDAPEYRKEDDASVTKDVSERLMKNGVRVLLPQRPQTVEEANQLIANLDILLGMRMHSNILAALNEVPFVAVSYEHKTEGIAEDLDMEEFCIPGKSAEGYALTALIKKAYEERLTIGDMLRNAIHDLRQRAMGDWTIILKHYAS